MRLTVQSGVFELVSKNTGVIWGRLHWEKQYDTDTESQYLVFTKGYAGIHVDSIDDYDGTTGFRYRINFTNAENKTENRYLYCKCNVDDVIYTSTYMRLIGLISFNRYDPSICDHFPLEIAFPAESFTLNVDLHSSDYSLNADWSLETLRQTVEQAEEITADGVVHIHNGTEYKKGILLIHDGTEFKRGIPLVHNGTEFVACK